jgi:phosphatidylserine decarboxylase
MDIFRVIIPNIHKEGYFFIFTFAVITLIMSWFTTILGIIGSVMTLWCVYFFRNPDRVTPIGDDLVISPADGVVQMIARVAPPAELSMGEELRTRISIFLNVFNVHVNRVPATGVIKKLNYHPGKFFNASLDKASIHNERQSVLMETKDGQEIAFVQIAGLIARRIICDLEENQQVESGNRFGIIRFGSRMDIYLPENVAPLVVVGQIAIGGETIIANLSNDKIMDGEIR